MVERRLRSGKNFDAISVGKDTWINPSMSFFCLHHFPYLAFVRDQRLKQMHAMLDLTAEKIQASTLFPIF